MHRRAAVVTAIARLQSKTGMLIRKNTILVIG
jgi:hypothetical protein